MKQLVLVAVLSAVASSALTALLTSTFRPPPAAPQGPAMTAADFKAALADLEREVAALRRESAERTAAAPAVREPGFSSVPGGDLAPAIAGSPTDAGRAGRPEPGTAETAAQLGRFRELLPRLPEGGVDYEGRIGFLRRWMFRGEREVLEWFGVPTRVDENEGGGETWRYVIPTGERDEVGSPVIEGFWIRLNRGRLIDLGD